MTKSEPMKITLLTNLTGAIVGARYRPNTSHESGHIATQIKPSPDQRIHEIDIPAELSLHILEGTLDLEIFKYKVEGVGQRAKLVKESAKPPKRTKS
jgi:hypothetical protein